MRLRLPFKLSIVVALVLCLCFSCDKNTEGAKEKNQIDTSSSVTYNHPSEIPANHLCPKIYKGDFFRLTGFEMGWFLLKPINIAPSRSQEAIVTDRLSGGQRALYFWWYLDAEVSNGGFSQFYFNGYGEYIPEIKKGLEYIGDVEMLKLVTDAHEVYLKYSSVVADARDDMEFGSKFYEDMEELEAFSSMYYKKNEQTMEILRQYALKRPNEFGMDLAGQPIDPKFTGTCERKDSTGKILETTIVKNGILEGKHTVYYESGVKKQETDYINGVFKGIQSKWSANAVLSEKRTTIDSLDMAICEETYYGNGQRSELTFKNKNDEKTGPHQEWYENGQLKVDEIYLNSGWKRVGEVKEYWKDGSPRLIANAFPKDSGRVTYQNYWDESGEQLLKDGNGKYYRETSRCFFESCDTSIYIVQLQDYQRHGISERYKNGVIKSRTNYKNGEMHGLYQYFDKEGKLKEESQYRNGKKVK